MRQAMVNCGARGIRRGDGGICHLCAFNRLLVHSSGMDGSRYYPKISGGDVAQ